jgi:hypothetical protein
MTDLGFIMKTSNDAEALSLAIAKILTSQQHSNTSGDPATAIALLCEGCLEIHGFSVERHSTTGGKGYILFIHLEGCFANYQQMGSLLDSTSSTTLSNCAARCHSAAVP